MYRAIPCSHPSYRYQTTKMKAFTILICALCLSTALGNTESLLKATSQHTEHSVHPRQTNCDVSQLVNYPSDCFEAVNAFSVSGMVPAVLCEPRCGQPVINFYLTCGLDFVVPTFVQNCGTNAMGQRCGTEMVQMAINRTSMEISSNCIGTIVFGSNCTTECQNTLTNTRQSLGCCIQLLNTTAITPNFINPVIDPQLWEGSCGVDLPAACPSSLTPTNTDGGTAAPTTDGPQTTPSGLPVVDNVASQSCSTPFEAVMAVVTDLVIPASSLQFADPKMKFFTETLRFTAEETNQVMENAIRHFNTQFGIDFSNVEPNEANQRFFEHGTFEPIATPFNNTVIANRWIVNGNTKSKCFPMRAGYFSIRFNDTTMLHGVYGGEEGKQVNAGDFVDYGYFAIFDACAQQPILIQFQSDVPGRILPVERWAIEEFRLYNRQLGRGRAQGVVKRRPSQDDPTMIIMEIQIVLSFP